MKRIMFNRDDGSAFAMGSPIAKIAEENDRNLPGHSVYYQGVLSGVFHAVCSNSAEVDPRKYVSMSADLYDSCWQLHELSYLLVLSLEHVFKNQEHALIISEGYDLGYNMPSVRQWHDEVSAFKDFLHEFEPYKTRPDGREFVILSSNQAMYVNGLIHYTEFMIGRVFQDMFETDYLKPFRNHREAGYVYKGANVGQQVSECYNGLNRLKRKVEDHKHVQRAVENLWRAGASHKTYQGIASDLA